MDTNDPPEAWHGDLPSAVARITPDHLILQQPATVRRLQCSACSKVLQATPRHKAQPRQARYSKYLRQMWFRNYFFYQPRLLCVFTLPQFIDDHWFDHRASYFSDGVRASLYYSEPGLGYCG